MENPFNASQKSQLIDLLSDFIQFSETYRDREGRSENARTLAAASTDARKLRAFIQNETTAVAKE